MNKVNESWAISQSNISNRNSRNPSICSFSTDGVSQKIVIIIASCGVTTFILGYGGEKTFQFLWEIQFKIGRTTKPYRKERGSLSLLWTSVVFFLLAIFSMSARTAQKQMMLSSHILWRYLLLLCTDPKQSKKSS